MTDKVSIGQFTVDENATASNELQWTMTTEQFRTDQQQYGNRTPDQKERIKALASHF